VSLFNTILPVPEDAQFDHEPLEPRKPALDFLATVDCERTRAGSPLTRSLCQFDPRSDETCKGLSYGHLGTPFVRNNSSDRAGLGDRCAILKPSCEVFSPQQELHVYAFSVMAFVRITNPLTVES
jgi:hypothetical protein